MNRFPLCPPQVPPMIGRTRLFKRMVDDLTKQTPQSLSLVGPRFFGKSVVLSALTKDPRLTTEYLCVIEWDLGHQIPQSDEEFIAAMRKKLAAGLLGKNDDLAKHLGQEEAGYDEMVESFELLEAENQRVLMLWDGVDPTIGSGKLTRNLWDNLLALGKKDSLVLVTSSRRKLQELIRDAQSVTSEFWLLFDPIKLEPMSETDITAFAAHLPGGDAQPGAITEIGNWSGGIPPLVVWLLNRSAEISDSALTKDTVANAAQTPDDKCAGILDGIWSDCSAPSGDLYRNILESVPLKLNDLPKIERNALLDAGFIVHHDGKVKSACRLLERHVGRSEPEFGALGRLFGCSDSYRDNIRGILERRLAQIPRFNEPLFYMVERAIGDLPNHPDASLHSLSHIEDSALDIVWKRETDADRCLKSEVIAYWTQSPRDKKSPHVRQMMDTDQWEIPSDRAVQLGLLRLLTGSHQDFSKPMARHASKDTYVLLDAIHSFRNRSQHSGGQPVTLGVAVSALMLCVELLACLEQETP